MSSSDSFEMPYGTGANCPTADEMKARHARFILSAAQRHNVICRAVPPPPWETDPNWKPDK